MGEKREYGVGDYARVLQDDRPWLLQHVGELGEIMHLSYAPQGYLELVTLKFPNGDSIAYWPRDLEAQA